MNLTVGTEFDDQIIIITEDTTNRSGQSPSGSNDALGEMETRGFLKNFGFWSHDYVSNKTYISDLLYDLLKLDRSVEFNSDEWARQSRGH